MSPGELQACNCAGSGWARRSFFVFFSYDFMAALKMGWKLEEVGGVGVGVGIGAGAGIGASVDGACDIVYPGELVAEMRGGKRNKRVRPR